MAAKGTKIFTTIHDGDSFIDGSDHATLEEALFDARETLILWEQEEISDKGWQFDENGIPHPTEEQIENWDYMINNCNCWVVEKDDQGNTVEEHYLTDEDYKEIGWQEWAELKF